MSISFDQILLCWYGGEVPEYKGEMVLTCACIRLALAIFSRPEHTSLLPPSTAHRLFWAPAKDTAPVSHTHTHTHMCTHTDTHISSLSADSAKCYKPIIICPHTFLLWGSHRPTLSHLFFLPSFIISPIFHLFSPSPLPFTVEMSLPLSTDYLSL